MRPVLITVILINLLLPLPVLADAFTLPQLVEMALEKNPAVLAAHDQTIAAGARAPQMIVPEDPLVGVMFDETPIDTIDLSRSMKRQYFFSQKIPFPGKMVSGYRAARAEARVFSAEERAAKRNIIKDVKKVFADIFAADESINISRQTGRLLDKAKGVAEEAYATGQSSIGDPVRAAVESGMVNQGILTLEQERSASVAALNALIGEPLSVGATFEKPRMPPLPSSVDALVEKMKAKSPDVEAGRNAAGKSGSELSLARQQYLPDFMLEVRYVERPGEQDAWTGLVGITLPLYGFARQRGEVNESKAMLNAAKRLETEKILKGEAEVREAYARAVAAHRSIKIFSEKIIPRARIAVASAEESYRAQKTDFLDLIDNIRRANDAKIMLIKAERDYIKAYADLERAVGEEL